MKNLFLLILFISATALAEESKTYKLIHEQSVIRIREEPVRKVHGIIELNSEFEKSSFQFQESRLVKFIGHTIEGNPQAFKVKGLLTLNGISREVEFTGRYVGPENLQNDHEKLLFQGKALITSQDFELPHSEESIEVKFHLLAYRPSAATSSLVKEVNDLIE